MKARPAHPRDLLRELTLALLPLIATVTLLVLVTQPAYMALLHGGKGLSPYAYQGLVQDVLQYRVALVDPEVTPEEREERYQQALSSASNRKQYAYLDDLEASDQFSLSTVQRALQRRTPAGAQRAADEAIALNNLVRDYSADQGAAYERAFLELRRALIGSAVFSGLLSLLLILRSLLLWRTDRLRAQQREERQREALNLASHEMRRPLQALLLSAEALRSARDEGMQQRLLTQIEDSAAQLASRADLTRLNDLYLDVTLRVQPADLGELVRRFSSSRVHVTAPSPVVWPVDANRVRQMLENLVENAVKYTQGTVEVTLDAPGGAPRVQVRDHGPGMSDELRGRVFLPYERGPQSLGPGSGLGLPLVRRYARAHGGDVSLTHAPGGGLLITLTFGQAEARVTAPTPARKLTPG
ncbi:HAMP domain-containing sensor histidine kinase [Deinococcus sp. JMULE3]|uniref:sensor histidine kinase n=1 Tax=Deinococcus sp. JMULE3 TaxID=2518341 RepID=UPI0015764C36|nr:HAMP domain-containing sensor histidine kinase [Deinococcus sp. JMULE3]NTY00136.1 HAMP domain-containing histidine kinase [Deinococcus sp. JMULE3]